MSPLHRCYSIFPDCSAYSPQHTALCLNPSIICHAYRRQPNYVLFLLFLLLLLLLLHFLLLIILLLVLLRLFSNPSIAMSHSGFVFAVHVHYKKYAHLVFFMHMRGRVDIQLSSTVCQGRGCMQKARNMHVGIDIAGGNTHKTACMSTDKTSPIARFFSIVPPRGLKVRCSDNRVDRSAPGSPRSSRCLVVV